MMVKGGALPVVRLAGLPPVHVTRLNGYLVLVVRICTIDFRPIKVHRKESKEQVRPLVPRVDLKTRCAKSRV
jgi:hypothetical protein